VVTQVRHGFAGARRFVLRAALALAVLAAILGETSAARAERAPQTSDNPGNPQPGMNALQKAGIASFGAGYAFNVIVATDIVLSAPLMHVAMSGVGTEYEGCLGEVCSKSPWLVSRQYWPLYVPVVGSLWTLSYDGMDDGGTVFYLGSSFALQAVGVGMFVTGTILNASSKSARVRTAPTLMVLPLFELEKQGLVARASF
jgi:hypothetical protein